MRRWVGVLASSFFRVWERLIDVYLPTYLLLVAADQAIKYQDPYIETGVVNALIFTACVILASLLVLTRESMSEMKKKSESLLEEVKKATAGPSAGPSFDTNMSKLLKRIGVALEADMGLRLMQEISAEYEKNKKEEGWVRPFTET